MLANTAVAQEVPADVANPFLPISYGETLAGYLTAADDTLGDGSRWGLNIRYSQEPPGALDTGGGIEQALPLLGDSPFAIINGDIFTQYPLARLRAIKCSHSHLVLVPNPEHNPKGDFVLQGGYVNPDGQPRLTFSGISVYHPRFFDSASGGRYSIVPMLREAMARVDCGSLEEVLIRTGENKTLIVPLTVDYFLVLTLGPQSLATRAAFKMRCCVTELRPEFE